MMTKSTPPLRSIGTFILPYCVEDGNCIIYNFMATIATAMPCMPQFSGGCSDVMMAFSRSGAG